MKTLSSTQSRFMFLFGWWAMMYPGSLCALAQRPLTAPTKIEFEAELDDVNVGGAGRFLALQFKSLKRIDILDVIERKIIGSVPLQSESSTFAAGASKLIVFTPESGVVSRFDLATQKKELTQIVEIEGGGTKALILGSDSEGPAIFSSGRGRDRTPFELGLPSLRTQRAKGARLRHQFSGCDRFRVSADGSVITCWQSYSSPTGLNVFVASDDEFICHNKHDSVGYVVPSADGQFVYTAKGIFSKTAKLIVESPGQNSLSIPAVSGPYYLTVTGGQGSQETVIVKMQGSNEVLCSVEGLAPAFQSNDWRGKEKWGIDRRLFFMPEQNAILQLADDRRMLSIVPFSITQQLSDSEVDYLLVLSNPPRTIQAGKELKYPIKVLSKAGGVNYRLVSATPGMTVSNDGVVSWNPTRSTPSETSFVVAVSDRSAREIFHLCSIQVIGGSEEPPKKRASRTMSKSEIPLPQSDVQETVVSVGLPADISDVALAGSGRFILCGLPSIRQVAVVDLCKAKVVCFLPTHSDKFFVVGGATRAVVVNSAHQSISRYRLDTFQHEATVALPTEDPVDRAAMGSASEGPILLRWSSAEDELAAAFFEFVSLKTLGSIKMDWGRGPSTSLRDSNVVSASSDGKVFSISGIGVISLPRGNKPKLVRNERAMRPSSDGSFFLSYDGAYSPDLKAIDHGELSKGDLVSSVTGNYIANVRLEDDRMIAKVFLPGSKRPLVSLTKELPLRGKPYLTDVGKRVFFVPQIRVMAVRSNDNRRIDILPFDLDQVMESSGVDYFAVVSRPETTVSLGQVYRYGIKTKSKNGGVKFALQKGPDGMTLSDEGVLSWTVPQDTDQPSHKVTVLCSDSSGQQVPHSFAINIPEVQRRLELAAEDARRSEQQRREIMRSANQRESAAAQPSSSTSLSRMRVWADSTGRHQIQGRFVEVLDRKSLVMVLANGESRTVPLARLSPDSVYEAIMLDLIKRKEIPPQLIESSSPFVKP